MKTVFLIKTPLQLLNAIEAKHYFKLDSEKCVLIIMGDRKSQPQILKLANVVHEWGNVIVLNDVNLFFGDPFDNKKNMSWLKSLWHSRFLSRSFFYVRRLNRISKYIGNVKYIFMGYEKYIYMRHFVNVVHHEKTFLLDDGNVTILVANDRQKLETAVSPGGLKKKLKLWGKRYLQGIRDGEKESLCFFTMYDVSPGKNDQVIKNNYKYIRSELDSLETCNEVYFLGSPISESNILSHDSYLEHLRRVKKYFADRKLLYIAHRRENPDNLKEIARDLNVEVKCFEYPIEYKLAILGPRPKILASFISSALDSSRLIFGSELNIISFKLDLDLSPVQDEIEPIYDSYKMNINESFMVETHY